MKLTIIRLQHFSDQDRIGLGKIWPVAGSRWFWMIVIVFAMPKL